MKLLELEDKIQNWIKNNKGKWYFILFGLGLGLGILSSKLFGSTNLSSFKTGIGYTFFLMIVEFYSGDKEEW